MPPRRTRNINDAYERIMARMEERLDQFVDRFANRMNDIMNLTRCKDHNGRRSKDEELGNPFFKGDCSSSNEWGDYGVTGDDYEGAPIFDDDYKEAYWKIVSGIHWNQQIQFVLSCYWSTLDEELENPFFEGDCSSSNKWKDYGVASDDYEGAPVFDDDYEAPVFNDNQFEEESMPIYDTDIEDVIEEEEGYQPDV
ncbi:hypothetical protein Tco_0913183 [Tanacetum coccineum]